LGFFEAAFGSSQQGQQSRPPNATSSGGGAESRTSVAAAPRHPPADRAEVEAPKRLDLAVDRLLTDVGYSPLVAVPIRSPALSVGAGVDLLQDDNDAAPNSGGGERTENGQLPQRAAPAIAVAPLSRETARYAFQKPDDIALVLRFVADLSTHSPDAARKVQHDGMHKLLLQAVRLMHLCNYDYEDIVLTLAYASVYWKYAFQLIGHKFTSNEAAHVCVLLIYLAHSFLLDETCKLWWWHNRIFVRYCSLEDLSRAVFRLLKLRGFRLRISHDEQLKVLLSLYRPPQRPPQRQDEPPEASAHTAALSSGAVGASSQCAAPAAVVPSLNGDKDAVKEAHLNNHVGERKNGEHTDHSEALNSSDAAKQKD